MAKVCVVTGKRPVTGNNVSHSQRKTRRRFLPNLHWHRFWVETENRFVRLRVSSKGMRIIDKKGIDAVLTWNDHETFGQLMWVAPDSVGIEFEENIGTKALMETRALQDQMMAGGGLDSHKAQQSQNAAKGWARGGIRI